MAIFTPSVSIRDPSTALGRNNTPPPTRDGGGDDHFDDGSPDFHVRLRRARLGLAVGVTGIVMIFVSFTLSLIHI